MTQDSDNVRLNKLMAERGLCSRREADAWIAAGRVRVNGEVAVMGQRVTPLARVEVDGQAQAESAARLTVLLHKPMGFVSGTPEDGHQPAVTLVTPERRWRGDSCGGPRRGVDRKDLARAGRLDADSTGLLVLTQDGRVARRLVGDQGEVEKEYLVRVTCMHQGQVVQQGVRTRVPAQTLARLRHGLALDGEALRPAQVEWQNDEQLRFVLRQGKKRQIRRMCEAVGLRVVGLKRVRIGGVALGQLPLGQWRVLGPNEAF
ncbi:MAG: pseudouridine synthase [Burkholderiaceae bacterium]